MNSGERIKMERNRQKITQRQLAEVLSIQQSTLSSYETGKHQPDNEMLTKIADALNVSTDYLLDRVSSPQAIIDENEQYYGLVTYGELIGLLKRIHKSMRPFLIMLLKAMNDKVSVDELARLLKMSSDNRR